MKRKFLVLILCAFIMQVFPLTSCSNKKAQNIQPILEKTPYYHFNLGNKYLSERKLELAISEYRKAIEIAPDSHEVYNNLGLACLFNKQYQQAIFSLNRALELNPNYSDAHNNLGMVYNVIGNQEKAIEEFSRALVNSNYRFRQNAYFNLGNIALNRENYDEAIFYFSKAIETDNNMAAAYDRLAFSFEKMGRTNEALENYRKALQIQPVMIETNYNLALLYFKLNRDEKAKYHFYQVKTLAPDTELGQKAEEFIKIINKRLNE